MKHSKKGSRGPRLYFSHFQNRILCAFLLCTLIPIFIIGGISYAVSYNIAKDKILNASISADAQLHTQFDNRLQQVENIADTLQYNMYNLMQADAPMDTLAMFSEIRSNLSMFKTSFDLAYINIFLPDEHMASSESLYFFPVSKLSDFQIPKEVLENPGTSSVWFYQDLLSVPFLVNNSYHITNSVSCCRVLKHPGTDSIKYAYIFIWTHLNFPPFYRKFSMIIRSPAISLQTTEKSLPATILLCFLRLLTKKNWISYTTREIL